MALYQIRGLEDIRICSKCDQVLRSDYDDNECLVCALEDRAQKLEIAVNRLQAQIEMLVPA